jgi:hypothetical protein
MVGRASADVVGLTRFDGHQKRTTGFDLTSSQLAAENSLLPFSLGSLIAKCLEEPHRSLGGNKVRDHGNASW